MFPIALAAIAAALIFTPTASAHVPAPLVPLHATAKAASSAEPYATTDPRLLAYRDRAIDFWTQAGYPQQCSPATVTLTSSLGVGVLGAAYEPSAEHCEIILTERHAGTVLFFMERGGYRNRVRRGHARYVVADFCRIVTHEMGHVAGLAWPVSEDGGMTWTDGHPVKPGVMSNENPAIPRSCWRQAQAAVPSR